MMKRMVLLAVMDAEPEDGFWAQPVDCERLSAELQLPVLAPGTYDLFLYDQGRQVASRPGAILPRTPSWPRRQATYREGSAHGRRFPAPVASIE